jgi:uncharacterized ferritin-like protein (DUF455 family)
MQFKVFSTLWAYLKYKEREIPIVKDEHEVEIVWNRAKSIIRPGRPDHLVQVKAARDMPKRGKAGSKSKRTALIHSLAHIESYAIDLSWDVILRFLGNLGEFREEFVQDWLNVAADEARHYSIWAHRLEEMDSFYGAFPAHDGLWESASNSRDDLCARLAIVHLVHEARGLDVAPQTLSRLADAGDSRSEELLQSIYIDEITHVGTAISWFKKFTPDDPIEKFKQLVRDRFVGTLKPPFNDSARTSAGFTPEWYMEI